jgi:hypothetical protein
LCSASPRRWATMAVRQRQGSSRQRHQAEALNANQMGLAPTGYPAHKSIRGIHLTMRNGSQFVHVMVTYAALDHVEAPAAAGDYIARFTRHRDRFEQVANSKFARGQVEDAGSITVLPGDL